MVELRIPRRRYWLWLVVLIAVTVLLVASIIWFLSGDYTPEMDFGGEPIDPAILYGIFLVGLFGIVWVGIVFPIIRHPIDVRIDDHKILLRTPVRKLIRLKTEVKGVAVESSNKKKGKTEVTVLFSDGYSFDFDSEYHGFQEAVELLKGVVDSSETDSSSTE